MLRIGKYTVIIVSLLLTVCCYADKKPLEPNWGVYDPLSTTKIDHRPWQRILHKYLYRGKDDVNLFHYGIVTNQDRTRLKNYLNYLQATQIQHYNRREQLAYWINLSNAKLVDIVLNRYPVDSPTSINLSKSPLQIGPFAANTLKVLGYPLSLKHIKFNILQKYWQDPRIIFALNLAAIGSPNLRQQAFQANNVESMLEFGTADFINSSRGAQVEYHRLSVSKLFVWHKKSFGNNDAGVIHFLQCYAKPKLYQQLKTSSYISHTYFNWSLNG